MFLLLLFASVALSDLTAQQSLIVFAADAAANTVSIQNRALLATLPLHERRMVDASDQLAIAKAIVESPQRDNEAWRRKFLAAYNKVNPQFEAAAYSPLAVSCTEPLGVNDTYLASEFLGAQVVLSGELFIDTNCDGVFSGNDSQNLLPSNFTIPLPFEIVQSTSDRRLKRIVSFLPFTRPRSIVQRVQPGMANALLPALAAFTHTTGADRTSEALYVDDGSVEAPVSRIEAESTGCVADVNGNRYNSAAISLRLAFQTLPQTPTEQQEFIQSGGKAGLCARADVAAAIANSTRSFDGGMVFLDVNNDGIRGPLEPTFALPPQLRLAYISNVVGGTLATTNIAIDSVGMYLSIDPTGDIVDRITTLVLYATVPIQQQFYVNVSALCGSVNPLLGPATISTLINSTTFVQNSFFLHTTFRSTQTFNTSNSGLVNITAQIIRTSRNPTDNVGLTCQRYTEGTIGGNGARAVIGIQTTCGAEMLTANQRTIVDVYRVDINTVSSVQLLPQMQRWLTTVATRPVGATTVTSTDRYNVLPFTVSVGNFSGASQPSASTSNTAQFSQLTITTVGQGSLSNSAMSFDVTITTQYARGNVPCAGVSGETIISEFVLNMVDVPIDMQIGFRGEMCVHTQPAECINGGPTLPPTAPPTSSPPTAAPGSSADRSVIAIVIYSIIVLILIVVVIVAGTR